MSTSSFLRSAALSLLLLLTLATQGRADFTFVHTSDTHVGETDGPESRAASDAALYREISKLEPRPAFVFNTGDVCEIGTDREYEIYRKTVRENLTIPAHDAPGNHDVRWNPRGKEGYTLGTGQPLYHSWDKDGVHFIALDSTVLLQHWGHFDQAQLNWLANDLKKVGPARPVVVGFHHPIGRDGSQVDNEQALLDVLSPYNVRLFLIGHGHSDIQWSVNGIPAIMAKGLYQGSYNLVQVTRDSLVVRRRTEQTKALSAPFLTVPLRRPAIPGRNVDVRVDRGEGRITVTSTELPPGAKLSYQIGDGDRAEQLTQNRFGWGGTFALGGASPGTLPVTVTATLPDGRAYQTPVLLDLSGTGTVRPLWKTNIAGAVQGKLGHYKDLVLIPSMGGDLVALDAATGRERWRAKTGGSIFSAPLAVDDTVYFGSADHFIYAVRADNGSLLWRTPTGGAVFGGAAKAAGVICIASVDKGIYGLDAATGKVLWKTEGEGMFQSQATTDGERFFVGGWDNYFRGLEARTGKELWKQKFGQNPRTKAFSFYYSPAIGSPTVSGDGKVFVSSNDGMLHAMETATGKVLWEAPGPALGYSGPLYRDGVIYNASLTGTGRIFAFDAATGEQKWETPTGSVIYDSSCAWGGGNLFVGCVNGTFSALRAEDGKLAWQYRLAPGHLLASPVTDEQRVFIGSLNGDVLAFPHSIPPLTESLPSEQ